MFNHLFLNRIKYYARSKSILFWIIVFPICLSIFFQLGLTNILDGEEFEKIDIAVVQDQAYTDDAMFGEILKSVANGDDAMFNVSYVNKDEADELLKASKISGYIYVDGNDNNDEKLVVKENGTSQTIIKEFMDVAKQKIAAVTYIYSKNNGQMTEEASKILNSTEEYTKSVNTSENKPNTVVAYFYTVLAMTCLYGAQVGVREIVNIQANLSPQGMRSCLSPVPKLRMFLANILASIVMQTLAVFIILGFLAFVLGVDFGSRYIYIIITTIVGSITGISLGTLLGAAIKKNEKTKTAIVTSFAMLCSFLAGMMDSSMKYKVMEAAPIIDRINPANLITDSYLKLYYYDNLSKYWENIYILIAMAAVCFAFTVLILRRQRYDSI